MRTQHTDAQIISEREFDNLDSVVDLVHPNELLLPVLINGEQNTKVYEFNTLADWLDRSHMSPLTRNQIPDYHHGQLVVVQRGRSEDAAVLAKKREALLLRMGISPATSWHQSGATPTSPRPQIQAPNNLSSSTLNPQSPTTPHAVRPVSAPVQQLRSPRSMQTIIRPYQQPMPLRPAANGHPPPWLDNNNSNARNPNNIIIIPVRPGFDINSGEARILKQTVLRQFPGYYAEFVHDSNPQQHLSHQPMPARQSPPGYYPYNFRGGLHLAPPPLLQGVIRH